MIPSIAIFGVVGSGKDTMGDELVRLYGSSGLHKTSFADPLKRAAQAMFGFSDAELWGPSKLRSTEHPEFPYSGWCFRCHEQCIRGSTRWDEANQEFVNIGEFWVCRTCREHYPINVTPRLVLKSLGTEYGRRLYLQLWTQRLYATENLHPFVITDGRFISEHEAAGAAGSFRILLTRGLQESTDTHDSESQVRLLAQHGRFDAVINNAVMSVPEALAVLREVTEPWSRQLVPLAHPEDLDIPVFMSETWRDENLARDINDGRRVVAAVGIKSAQQEEPYEEPVFLLYDDGAVELPPISSLGESLTLKQFETVSRLLREAYAAHR